MKMKSEKKKVKRHMVFLLFYCISFRCRLLEGFGCGGEFTKKNLEWMFWKVLAVKTNSQKTVKTPHGFPLFFVFFCGISCIRV